MTESLREWLTRQVESGLVPGAVAVLGGPEAEPVVVGTSGVGGPPLARDAIFRIQSMTKAVVAVATLRLVEAGRLELDSSIEPWMPELADRRVLSRPDAALADTVAAARPVTVRHLLTNTSGYGIQTSDSPLAAAMEANETAAGSAPVPFGADEWVTRMADLPLTFQPGQGWRYHHSYGLLGVLLARVTGRPLHDHLTDDLFAPLGMVDTGLWVPTDQRPRLLPAYRREDGGLVETEPAGGGPYAGPPPHAVDHGELVSTLADFRRFLLMLTRGGQLDGRPFLSPEHLQLMTHDQVPASAKGEDSFFPGFWDGAGWGLGVQVFTGDDHPGRYGWSGGQGTDFFVDPDQTIGILLTQVEMGPEIWALLQEFRTLDAAG